MEFVSNIAIGVGSVVAAFIALIGVVFGIKTINKQKSFELLMETRLRTIGELREHFNELRKIVYTVEEKRGIKCEDIETYGAQMNSIICSLQTLLTLSERQEHHLLKEIDNLKMALLDYLSYLMEYEDSKKSKDENMSDEKAIYKKEKSKEKLLQQADVVFAFSDIYIWAIWQYIQRLYDSSEKKHHVLFDKVFEDVYSNYLHTNTEKPEFFDKYPIERLIDPIHNQKKKGKRK